MKYEIRSSHGHFVYVEADGYKITDTGRLELFESGETLTPLTIATFLPNEWKYIAPFSTINSPPPEKRL
jgi:hypothetical protein